MNAIATDTQLEYPSCPVCLSARREVRYSEFGPHNIVRCCSCDVHYLFPRLREDVMQLAYAHHDYFENGRSGYADVSYSVQEHALRATFKRLLHTLKRKNLTGGALLEVGCGYGYLLDEARPFFSFRVGTELSASGVRIASERADKVFQGGVEELPASLEFDCVIATHVIEHIYHPLEFISKLTHHVKPNGTILLAAPDMGGLLRRIMKRRWPSFKTPEHVTYFDVHTLSALMKKAGLVDLSSVPYLHAFPLSLIASKLRLPTPPMLGTTSVWVPTTTVAVCGTVPHE